MLLYDIKSEVEINQANGEILTLELDVQCGLGHEDFSIESHEIVKMFDEDGNDIENEVLKALVTEVYKTEITEQLDKDELYEETKRVHFTTYDDF